MHKRDLLKYVPGVSWIVDRVGKLGRSGKHQGTSDPAVAAGPGEDVSKSREDLLKQNQELRRAHAAHVSFRTRLMTENQLMRKTLHDLVFGDDGALSEPGSAEDGGLPLPGPSLRYLVAGTDSLEWFLGLGRVIAQAVAAMMARQGQTLDSCRRILDFGCGCGRILRHMRAVTKAELYGSDCNKVAVRWCQQNLPIAQFGVNGMEPPLDYPDAHFGLIYAISILTHFTEPLQNKWMAEFRRILAPGGYLLLTLHGDACLENLTPAQRARYQEGQLVMAGAEGVVGSNFCNAYHPQRYVREVLAPGFGFAVVDFVPQGSGARQDAYLLKLTA